MSKFLKFQYLLYPQWANELVKLIRPIVTLFFLLLLLQFNSTRLAWKLIQKVALHTCRILKSKPTATNHQTNHIEIVALNENILSSKHNWGRMRPVKNNTSPLIMMAIKMSDRRFRFKKSRREEQAAQLTTHAFPQFLYQKSPSGGRFNL